METSNYLCWYAYSGQETEGRLELCEPLRFEANDKAEALWKYHCYLAMQRNEKPFFKNLSEYKISDYADGGWGFFVIKIDESECRETAESIMFRIFYKDNKYDL